MSQHLPIFKKADNTISYAKGTAAHKKTFGSGRFQLTILLAQLLLAKASGLALNANPIPRI
jgi:hypothetical protein